MTLYDIPYNWADVCQILTERDVSLWKFLFPVYALWLNFTGAGMRTVRHRYFKFVSTKLAVFIRTLYTEPIYWENQRENTNNIVEKVLRWPLIESVFEMLDTVDQSSVIDDETSKENDFDDDDDGNEDNDYDRLDCACEKITTSTG